MSELGKPFLKKIKKIDFKKEKMNVKIPHVNKKSQARNENLVQKKLGLERTMNGLGKPLRKKSDPNNWKTVKIEMKLHVHKKQPTRKRIFVQTRFSHSTLKIERINFKPQNHSLFRFRSISCFGVTKLQKS